MILKEQMFEPMLEACPSFVPEWTAFCSDFQAEIKDGFPCEYIALAALARHLRALHESGTTGEFHAVFEVVERWHCEGEHYVKEAATVGLLEDLQNDEARGEVFKPWLLPESKKWWDRLIRFWDGDVRALRDE